MLTFAFAPQSETLIGLNSNPVTPPACRHTYHGICAPTRTEVRFRQASSDCVRPLEEPLELEEREFPKGTRTLGGEVVNQSRQPLQVGTQGWCRRGTAAKWWGRGFDRNMAGNWYGSRRGVDFPLMELHRRGLSGSGGSIHSTLSRSRAPSFVPT